MATKTTIPMTDRRRHKQEQPPLVLLFNIASLLCTRCSIRQNHKLRINFGKIPNKQERCWIAHKDCLPGSFDRRDCRLSSLVPSMVIFLRIEDACRWASGPDAGSEFLSDIMFVMSSESLTASLYSLTQESPEDAIG
ncbi:S-locus lectin protein kinase family protein [Striga asiatica]|uniref:S-locus lectin protein kinase family protein n=1 Tax=Striga asiatica TaxID=4170 RepID=A0A5A7RKD3_STRAF|nr:S-locus lectin protein kinase family protein [Striga asiatica]